MGPRIPAETLRRFWTMLAHSQAFFYRTAGGVEMDLVIDHPGGERWAIEVKRSLTPALTRSFHQARADLHPHHCFVVIPRELSWRLIWRGRAERPAND